MLLREMTLDELQEKAAYLQVDADAAHRWGNSVAHKWILECRRLVLEEQAYRLAEQVRKPDVIVDAIIADLSDRRGIGGQWDCIDEETQGEIRAKWMAIVEKGGRR